MVLMGENPIATDTTSTVWTRLTTEDSWQIILQPHTIVFIVPSC